MAKRLTRTRVRLWQAGDMPGEGNSIAHMNDIRRLVAALNGLEAFGYSHKPVCASKGVPKRLAESNAKKIKFCNDSGVTINLSANNPSHADDLIDLGIGPVTTTLPADTTKNAKTPNGRKIVLCPATISDDVSCNKCGGSKGALCFRKDRNFVIGFPAHGFRAKKVSEVSRET